MAHNSQQLSHLSLPRAGGLAVSLSVNQPASSLADHVPHVKTVHNLTTPLLTEGFLPVHSRRSGSGFLHAPNPGLGADPGVRTDPCQSVNAAGCGGGTYSPVTHRQWTVKNTDQELSRQLLRRTQVQFLVPTPVGSQMPTTQFPGCMTSKASEAIYTRYT